MFDDPQPDLPDVDTVYANYLRTCAMIGGEPVSRECADKLVAEWGATIGPAMARGASCAR